MISLSGHGGDGFLKFQDAEEVSSVELADAFEQMWQKRRYEYSYIVLSRRFKLNKTDAFLAHQI